MPNTKSAERRARSSARRQVLNRSIKSRVATLDKQFDTLLAAGKKDDALKALRAASSALDKAAKSGVIPKARADRKKGRLTLQLNKLK